MAYGQFFSRDSRPVILRRHAILIMVGVILFGFVGDRPYVPPSWWMDVYWQSIVPGLFTIFFLIFLFTKGKFSKQAIQDAYKAAGKSEFVCRYMVWLDPIILAAAVSLCVFSLPPSLTSIFANQNFEENVTIVNVECQLAHGKRSPYTAIIFVDQKNSRVSRIMFNEDFCINDPNYAVILHDSDVTLQGREWFLGRYYNKPEHP